MGPSMKEPQILLARKTAERNEMAAREFLFKRAVTAYLDEMLRREYLVYSIEDLFPALSKRIVEKIVRKLELDRSGGASITEAYIDSLWVDFAKLGKLN